MNKIFKTSLGELRWGWKTAILIIGTILFGIVLNTILMTALTIGFSSQDLAQEQAMEQATLASSGFILQVVMSVLQLSFMLWLMRWLITKVEKQEFVWAALGLNNTQRSKLVWQGLSLSIVLTLLTIGIGFLSGTLKFMGNGFQLFPSIQVFTTLLLAIVLAFVSGFGEEVAFRGYLQSRIAQRYSSTIAVLIVAVLFAVSHPVANSNDPLLYLATATLVGILFGTIFVRTGSIWMGIALHTVWNYIQIAVVAVRNSADERFFGAPLFVFDNISPTTQRLIEFGVILAGLLLIIWLTKPAMNSLPTKGQKNASTYS